MFCEPCEKEGRHDQIAHYQVKVNGRTSPQCRWHARRQPHPRPVQNQSVIVKPPEPAIALPAASEPVAAAAVAPAVSIEAPSLKKAYEDNNPMPEKLSDQTLKTSFQNLTREGMSPQQAAVAIAKQEGSHWRTVRAKLARLDIFTWRSRGKKTKRRNGNSRSGLSFIDQKIAKLQRVKDLLAEVGEDPEMLQLLREALGS